MARREVLEVTCDRCGRTETQPKSDVHDGEGAEFSATFRKQSASYQDLCTSCRRAIKNYFDRAISVTPETRLRNKKEEELEEVEDVEAEPPPGEPEDKARGEDGDLRRRLFSGKNGPRSSSAS